MRFECLEKHWDRRPYYESEGVEAREKSAANEFDLKPESKDKSRYVKHPLGGKLDMLDHVGQYTRTMPLSLRTSGKSVVDEISPSKCDPQPQASVRIQPESGPECGVSSLLLEFDNVKSRAPLWLWHEALVLCWKSGRAEDVWRLWNELLSIVGVGNVGATETCRPSTQRNTQQNTQQNTIRILPDTASIVARTLHDARDISGLLALHASMEHIGLLPGDVDTLNAILNAMMCRHKSAGDHLERLYKRVRAAQKPTMDIVSHRLIIQSYLASGKVDKALKVFERLPTECSMRNSHILSEMREIYNSFFRAWGDLEENAHMISLFEEMMECKYAAPDRETMALLMLGLKRAGDVRSMLKLYHSVPTTIGEHPGVTMVASLLQVLADQGDVDAMLEVYNDIVETTAQDDFNVFLLTVCMREFARLGQVDVAFRALGICRERSSVKLDVVAYNAIIHGLTYRMKGISTRILRLQKHITQNEKYAIQMRARSKVRAIPDASSSTPDIEKRLSQVEKAISDAAENVEEARQQQKYIIRSIERVYDEMLQEDLYPDIRTLVGLLRAYDSSANLAMIRHVLSMAAKHDIILNEFFFTTTLDVLGKAGRIKEMISAFSEMMKLPNIELNKHALTVIVSHLGRSGHIKEMMQFYYEMEPKVVGDLDQRFFTTMFAYLGRVGDMSRIQKLLGELSRHNITPDAVMYETLIEIIGRVGNIQQVVDTLDEMIMHQGMRTGMLTFVNVFRCMRTNPAQASLIGKAYDLMKRVGVDPDQRLAETIVACIREHCRKWPGPAKKWPGQKAARAAHVLHEAEIAHTLHARVLSDLVPLNFALSADELQLDVRAQGIQLTKYWNDLIRAHRYQEVFVVFAWLCRLSERSAKLLPQDPNRVRARYGVFDINAGMFDTVLREALSENRRELLWPLIHESLHCGVTVDPSIALRVCSSLSECAGPDSAVWIKRLRRLETIVFRTNAVTTTGRGNGGNKNNMGNRRNRGNRSNGVKNANARETGRKEGNDDHAMRNCTLVMARVFLEHRAFADAKRVLRRVLRSEPNPPYTDHRQLLFPSSWIGPDSDAVLLWRWAEAEMPLPPLSARNRVASELCKVVTANKSEGLPFGGVRPRDLCKVIAGLACPARIRDSWHSENLAVTPVGGTISDLLTDLHKPTFAPHMPTLRIELQKRARPSLSTLRALYTWTLVWLLHAPPRSPVLSTVELSAVFDHFLDAFASFRDAGLLVQSVCDVRCIGIEQERVSAHTRKTLEHLCDWGESMLMRDLLSDPQVLDADSIAAHLLGHIVKHLPPLENVLNPMPDVAMLSVATTLFALFPELKSTLDGQQIREHVHMQGLASESM